MKTSDHRSGGWGKLLKAAMDNKKGRKESKKIKGDCVTCGTDFGEKCPESKRPCGHHCNHSWTHDKCCWCGKEFK